MVDNKKKKKQDRKRISLTQIYEVMYLKKIAKEQLTKLGKQNSKQIWGANSFDVTCSKAKLMRICKALIKYIEKK